MPANMGAFPNPPRRRNKPAPHLSTFQKIKLALKLRKLTNDSTMKDKLQNLLSRKFLASLAAGLLVAVLNHFGVDADTTQQIVQIAKAIYDGSIDFETALLFVVTCFRDQPGRFCVFTTAKAKCRVQTPLLILRGSFCEFRDATSGINFSATHFRSNQMSQQVDADRRFWIKLSGCIKLLVSPFQLTGEAQVFAESTSGDKVCRLLLYDFGNGGNCFTQFSCAKQLMGSGHQSGSGYGLEKKNIRYCLNSTRLASSVMLDVS